MRSERQSENGDRETKRFSYIEDNRTGARNVARADKLERLKEPSARNFQGPRHCTFSIPKHLTDSEDATRGAAAADDLRGARLG